MLKISPRADVSAPGSATTPTAAAAVQWANSVLYDDAHVRIEISVRSPPSDTVVITFDPIMYGASEAAFGGDFLHRAQVDTLAVRKKSENFYQPLDRDHFLEITAAHLRGYQRRFAYGSSLGAYAALYFCAHGVDGVIASSPRVSAHPRYGSPHWQKQIEFQHHAFDPEHPASSPAVIIYDPKDAPDRAFVEREVLPAWPKAQVLQVPYSGHPSNQFLADIGFIAPFVRARLAGQPAPELNRRRDKAKSGMYVHVLATHCLARGKFRWAVSLAEHSLRINPLQQLPLCTLGQAEMALGRLDRAEELLTRFAALHPTDGGVQLSLKELHRLRQSSGSRKEPVLAPAATTAPPRPTAAVAAQLRRPARQLLAAGLRRVFRILRTRLGLPGGVTREHVDWCFRTLLGRPPESEAVVAAHLDSPNFQALVRRITTSPEFTRRATRASTPRSLAKPPRGANAADLPAMLVSANCQTAGLAAALQHVTGCEEVGAVPAGDTDPDVLRAMLQPHAARARLWIVSAGNRVARELFAQRHAAGARLVTVPLIHFTAFHPDVCHAWDLQTRKPTQWPYNSAIVVWAYGQGLDAQETAALFRRGTFRALGYLDAWDPSVNALRHAFAASDLRDRFSDFMLHVKRQGCFMHTTNHPRIDVLGRLARMAAEQAGLPVRAVPQPGELADGLNGVVWPVYPEIAHALAIPGGGYTWKMLAAGQFIDGPEAFVESSFASYRAQGIRPQDLAIRFWPADGLDSALRRITGR